MTPPIARNRHGFRSVSFVAVLAATFLTLCGCERQREAASEETAGRKIVVYTTFYPTTYFTERIGGQHVEAVCPLPDVVDPAFWMPSDTIIAAYQKADLIVINGASFEHWLQKVSLPQSRIVDTTEPLKDEFITIKDTVTHSHGPSGEHTHEGVDGHTWLDPANAKTQAGEIKQALAKEDPAHAADFTANYALLAQDLDRLDERFRRISEMLGDQVLLCSHPAYNYVARRYGWRVQNFHLDPAVVPNEDDYESIRTFLEENDAKIMLWEALPLEPVAAGMRDLGLTNVIFAPCELLDSTARAEGENFLSVMNHNLDGLETALRE